MIDLGKVAERAWANRRARDRAFGDSNLFGEPAWDILLDLAMSEAKGQAVPVSSASAGAGIPLTTALRHVQLLIEAGLIEKHIDITDRRRSFLRLTKKGKRCLLRYADKTFMLQE